MIEYIGITIKDREVIEPLQELLDKKTHGSMATFTTTARDSSLTMLLAIPARMADDIRGLLRGEAIPELVLPQASARMDLHERMAYVRMRLDEIGRETREIEQAREDFSRHWLSIYREGRKWTGRRSILLRTTAHLFETGQCFFLYGWMPSAEVAMLADKFAEKFAGRVVVGEREIRQRELENVPVALHNAPYFKPFEVFASLLPLPSYTSFDPTVFIGIFFPVFFGMILGDVGYGLLLVIIAVVVRRAYGGRKLVRDLTAILLVCSIYTILFGFVFGELFGELGHVLFGLTPLWLSRAEAVIPMLIFSISIGIFHILLGLFFGVLVALRKREVGEALFKGANILSILCLTTLFIIRDIHIHPHQDKALVVVLALLLLVAVLAGGMLAPLELLKSIGNIISYARIMAIGLASVLLATMANVLGGMTGDIVTGAVVAVLFHAINIILGVFAPAIQSLRLHFVEFFSKFIEHGGRKYQPFK